ncbi:MAG: hypothetical protein ABUK01_06430 [Leptospirales bacterium]
MNLYGKFNKSLLILVIVFVYYCGSGNPGPAEPGKLVIRYNPTQFDYFTELNIQYFAVQVVHSFEIDGPQTIIDLGADPGEINFIGFPKEIPPAIGTFEVEPGFVHQILQVFPVPGG